MPRAPLRVHTHNRGCMTVKERARAHAFYQTEGRTVWGEFTNGFVWQTEMKARRQLSNKTEVICNTPPPHTL